MPSAARAGRSEAGKAGGAGSGEPVATRESAATPLEIESISSQRRRPRSMPVRILHAESRLVGGVFSDLSSNSSREAGSLMAITVTMATSAGGLGRES
eukprot:4590664-Prymnesium_polylepis.3